MPNVETLAIVFIGLLMASSLYGYLFIHINSATHSSTHLRENIRSDPRLINWPFDIQSTSSALVSMDNGGRSLCRLQGSSMISPLYGAYIAAYHGLLTR